MIVAQYFDYFIIFSFIGWIYECIYCTIQEQHWQNRGFLFGPICPIYGCGVVAAMTVFHLLPMPEGTGEYPIWMIFLVCAAGSAVMEYSTSWVLEHFFHAVWWDYSNLPLNVNGRICLPASCGFGAAGILVVKVVMPFLQNIPANEHPVENELICLIFAIILGADLALTVASLTRIVDRLDAMEQEFNSRMEAGYQTAQQGPAAVGTAAKAAAISAGETAMLAAMLATDSAKAAAERSGQEMYGRMQKMLEGLDRRDRYHIRSIRGLRFQKRKNSGEEKEKGQAFLRYIQENAVKRQSRRRGDK